MDKRRLYDINKECSGNRMILNKSLKEDEHQSLTISYEEFENIKDIEYKLTDDTRVFPGHRKTYPWSNNTR